MIYSEGCDISNTTPVYFNISSENPKPQKNEIRFHGTMEEFQRYLPELYQQMNTKKSINAEKDGSSGPS